LLRGTSQASLARSRQASTFDHRGRAQLAASAFTCTSNSAAARVFHPGYRQFCARK